MVDRLVVEIAEPEAGLPWKRAPPCPGLGLGAGDRLSARTRLRLLDGT
jgi:hypothetical protein